MGSDCKCIKTFKIKTLLIELINPKKDSRPISLFPTSTVYPKVNAPSY